MHVAEFLERKHPLVQFQPADAKRILLISMNGFDLIGAAFPFKPPSAAGEARST